MAINVVENRGGSNIKQYKEVEEKEGRRGGEIWTIKKEDKVLPEQSGRDNRFRRFERSDLVENDRGAPTKIGAHWTALY